MHRWIGELVHVDAHHQIHPFSVHYFAPGGHVSLLALCQRPFVAAGKYGLHSQRLQLLLQVQAHGKVQPRLLYSRYPHRAAVAAAVTRIDNYPIPLFRGADGYGIAVCRQYHHRCQAQHQYNYLSYQTPLAHMTHLTGKSYVIEAVLIPFWRILFFSQDLYTLSCMV